MVSTEMKFLSRVYFLLGVCVAVLSVGAEDGQDPEPFSKDEFSGKTVLSAEMAQDVAIGRFFNAPKYGTRAPAFALTDIDSGETVTLTDLRKEKPLVLFFGSYGCDVMRGSVDIVVDLYEEYKDRVDFVMIYIREAHALDGFGSERARVEDPKSTLERIKVARLCRDSNRIPFRVLVDPVDDRVATRWAAWPIRLFVVDRGGTVVYAGKPGPWGFSPGKGFVAQHAEEMRKHEDRFNQESLDEFLEKYLELVEDAE